MNIRIKPMKLDIVSPSYVDQDEGCAQTPNSSSNWLFIVSDETDALEKEEECNHAVISMSSKVNSSIKFRRPSNAKPWNIRSSSYDEDTQCDTCEDESDDDSIVMTEEEAQTSREQYLRLMHRTYYVVKETKEARYRGLLSPILLRNKLYDFLAVKTTPVEADMLFEVCDFKKTPTIRQKSRSVMENTQNQRLSKTFNKKSLRRSMDKGETVEEAFSSLFNFLATVNN